MSEKEVEKKTKKRSYVWLEDGSLQVKRGEEILYTFPSEDFQDMPEEKELLRYGITQKLSDYLLSHSFEDFEVALIDGTLFVATKAPKKPQIAIAAVQDILRSIGKTETEIDALLSEMKAK